MTLVFGVKFLLLLQSAILNLQIYLLSVQIFWRKKFVLLCRIFLLVYAKSYYSNDGENVEAVRGSVASTATIGL